jgi:hypothetical protein
MSNLLPGKEATQNIGFMSLRLCLASSVRDDRLILRVLDKRLLCEEKFGNQPPGSI